MCESHASLWDDEAVNSFNFNLHKMRKAEIICMLSLEELAREVDRELELELALELRTGQPQLPLCQVSTAMSQVV